MDPKTLTHYLETWDLSDPQPLAQTRTSHVYTVRCDGETAVLKLLTPMGAKDEFAGAVALRHFDGRGAVRLLRHDERAHLLEYADGEDLVWMAHNGGDEQSSVIIAGVLNELHSTTTGSPLDGLHLLGDWFQALFDKAEQDRQAGEYSIYRRAVPVARALLANPQEQRVLHGDIHHENIRYRVNRGWLAFDPKGLYGERTYDAANTLCNLVDSMDHAASESLLLRNAEILATHLRIALPRLLAYTFAYVCLSGSWCLEDGDDDIINLHIAEILEPHVEAEWMRGNIV